MVVYSRIYQLEPVLARSVARNNRAVANIKTRPSREKSLKLLNSQSFANLPRARAHNSELCERA